MSGALAVCFVVGFILILGGLKPRLTKKQLAKKKALYQLEIALDQNKSTFLSSVEAAYDRYRKYVDLLEAVKKEEEVDKLGS